MKYLILILIVSLSTACADMKFRWKNVNGDRTQAQLEKDWRDCYEHSANQNQMQNCIDKKGYYSESYTD